MRSSRRSSRPWPRAPPGPRSPMGRPQTTPRSAGPGPLPAPAPSFNDDIQGTGAVVLAGLLAARRERGGLTCDRFMFVGAGAAAIGIATLLRRELMAEGMDGARRVAAIVMLDSHGLVHSGSAALPDDQRPFAVDPRRSPRGRAPTGSARRPRRHRTRQPSDRPDRRDRLHGRLLRGARPGSRAP